MDSMPLLGHLMAVLKLFNPANTHAFWASSGTLKSYKHLITKNSLSN